MPGAPPSNATAGAGGLALRLHRRLGGLEADLVVVAVAERLGDRGPAAAEVDLLLARQVVAVALRVGQHEVLQVAADHDGSVLGDHGLDRHVGCPPLVRGLMILRAGRFRCRAPRLSGSPRSLAPAGPAAWPAGCGPPPAAGSGRPPRPHRAGPRRCPGSGARPAGLWARRPPSPGPSPP